MDITLEEMRIRAKALGIKRADDMGKPELIRAMQSATGKPPCLNQRVCRPDVYHACNGKDGCSAQLAAATGLILSNNMIAGYQIAHLLASAYGWKMQVLSRDKPAYRMISEGHVDVLVADIDSAELGGFAVLAYTRRHWPAVTAYAITRNEDAYVKQLARDMGGCHSFFYLAKGRPGLDMQCGLAAQISEQAGREKSPRLDASPQHTSTPSPKDQNPSFFSLLKRNQHSE